MSAARRFLRRLFNALRPGRAEADLAREIASHVSLLEDEYRRRGLSDADARRQARLALGGVEQAKELHRDARSWPSLDSWRRDFVYGSRTLRKNAVVTTAAIVSLAVAIGSCVTAFSLIDALFLRRLPVPSPDRLVYLKFPNSADGTSFAQNFSHPFFTRLRDAGTGVIDLFGTSDQVRRAATFAAAGVPDEVRIRYVTGAAFGALQVQPEVGRLLSPADDEAGAPRAVAVLSHAFWQRRFGGDHYVIGTMCAIGERRFEIVGIAEPGFSGLEPGRDVDVWLPVGTYDAKGFTFTNKEWNWLFVVGRLRGDAPPDRAGDALQAAFSQFRREVVTNRRGTNITPEQIERYVNTPLVLASAATGATPLRRQFDRPLWLLSILVGLVLLIAMSNVLNLFLARAAAREREMSVMLSLGATRGRLVRLVLIESFVLSAIACVFGLGLAIVAGPAIVRMLAPSVNPIGLHLGADWRVLGFLALTGTAAAMACGLVPALRASGVAPIGVLGTGRGSVSARQGISWPLVAAQVSFSVAVLFVAGLFLVSYGQLATTDLGFRADGVLLARLGAPDAREAELVRTIAFDAVDRVRAIPGVRSASLSGWPLFNGGGWISSVRVPGQPDDPVSPSHLAVAPEFFTTVGMRLVEGRDFERRDSDPAEPANVVVNEAFVRRFLGPGPAVGRRYDRVGQGTPVPQEIIGVVTDARNDDPRAAPPPSVYVASRGLGTMAIRTDGDPLRFRAQIDAALRDVHPSLGATSYSLQSALVSNSMLREELLAWLSSFFAFVGLLLAAVGLYGVLTCTVIHRTREIAIRSALGARPGALVSTILREAVVVTEIGVGVGLTAGVYLSRFVQTLLFDVQPTSLTSLALPTAFLLLSAIAATGPAAWRAVRLSPTTALRSD